MRVAKRAVAAAAGLGLLTAGLLIADKFRVAEITAAVEDKPKFAQDRTEGEKVIEFNKDRAMGYLKQICDLGPRMSGTEAMTKQQEIIQKHLEGQGAKVELQKFTARQRSQKQPVPMINLIARWYPERAKRVLLSAHYDTRPIADREPDPRNWRKTFVGANDGAGGCALMMELAHHIGALPTQVGIDFVLFDGEEYVFDSSDTYFFGSEYFAQEYSRKRANEPRSPKYLSAIVVDMVCGKDAQFYWEQYSYTQAGPLAEAIWRVAADVRADAFKARIGPSAMQDDHLALLKVRIPTIDIIDVDYPHWHRLTDVPANCSGETMEQVARVLAAWMQRSR